MMQERRTDEELSTAEFAHREHRMENEQGATQVEATEDVAPRQEQGNPRIPSNEMSAQMQSGRTPGSPIVSEHGEAERAPIPFRPEAGEPPQAQRPTGPAAAPEGRQTPLFAQEEATSLRSRWDTIQTAFVDDPRHAVQEADRLVAETMQRLAEVFADERADLERQWSRGDDASTEDLRMALRRYRTFFDRLLSI